MIFSSRVIFSREIILKICIRIHYILGGGGGGQGERAKLFVEWATFIKPKSLIISVILAALLI